MDLLALYFTAAKILFVSGALPCLPALVRLIGNMLQPVYTPAPCLPESAYSHVLRVATQPMGSETVRRGHLLHTTTVRNEHAYYCCIAQLLPQLQAAMGKALRVPAASTGAGSASASASTASAGGGAGGGAGAGVPVGAAASVTGDPIYVFGDSHTLATAWRTITVGDAEDGGSSQGRLLVPRLATGVKAWHLRPASRFYPKHNFEAVLASIPDGSDVVMLFCEIDCREGLLLAVERCKYPSLTKAIEVVVGIYMDVLRRLRDKHKLRVGFHNGVGVVTARVGCNITL